MVPSFLCCVYQFERRSVRVCVTARALKLLLLLSCTLCAPATDIPLCLLTLLSLIFSFSSSSVYYFLYILLHPTSVPITFHIYPLSLCLPPSALPLFLSSIPHSFTQERNAVIFLLLPKPPVENIGLIKVKGKGLKRKVFHASCEWYAETEKRQSTFSFIFPPITV